MEKVLSRSNERTWLKVALSAFSFVFALLTAPMVFAAPATAFVVDSTADEADDAVGSGGCHTLSGHCTLRAAIQEANFAGGSHGISLPSGTITLTITGAGEDNAATGDLDIKTQLFITGTGSATTIIDGGGLDRVFHRISGGAIVMSDLTITNGDAGASGGGGIKNSDGSLTLNNVVVSKNVASYAGGIENVGSIAATTLNSTTVSGNSGNPGGGIHNNTGMLTLTSSTVFNNIVGGGISNSGGTVNITNSSVYSNSSGTNGGGLANTSFMYVTNSSIYSNTASAGKGGGIYTGATLNLIATQVYSNTANEGGGIYDSGGLIYAISSTIRSNTATDVGGIYVNNPGYGSRSTTLENSTVSDNSAVGANPKGLGGGILTGASLTVTNSTISGNNARIGGGLFGTPGLSQSIVISNSTIANNSASGTGGGYWVNSGAGTQIIKNSIIAKNIGNSASPDCGGSTLTSNGYNIIGKNTGCTFSSTTGDQVGTGGSPIDPKLGPLSNVGGPTAVHSLVSGSPAIDNGNACEATDQRGVARPIGGGCDIGAFEGTGAALYLPLILR